MGAGFLTLGKVVLTLYCNGTVVVLAPSGQVTTKGLVPEDCAQQLKVVSAMSSPWVWAVCGMWVRITE